MPKLKTNRGAAKRFKVTKNGKVKYTKANRRHLLECKNSKKSRKMRASVYVKDCDARNVKTMLPYL